VAGDAPGARRRASWARRRCRAPVGAGLLARDAVAAPRVAKATAYGGPREPLPRRFDAGARAGSSRPPRRPWVELSRRRARPGRGRSGHAQRRRRRLRCRRPPRPPWRRQGRGRRRSPRREGGPRSDGGLRPKRHRPPPSLGPLRDRVALLARRRHARQPRRPRHVPRSPSRSRTRPRPPQRPRRVRSRSSPQRAQRLGVGPSCAYAIVRDVRATRWTMDVMFDNPKTSAPSAPSAANLSLAETLMGQGLARATASISTRAPRGRALTWTVTRAG